MQFKAPISNQFVLHVVISPWEILEHYFISQLAISNFFSIVVTNASTTRP